MTRFATCLLALLSVVAAACSTPHAFGLEDVASLTVGRSTRSEVEQVLGPPSARLERVALYEAQGSEVSPPAPLSFITWPVYFGQTTESFVFLARYDVDGKLTEASLTLAGFQAMFILLFINPHGPMGFDGLEHRDVLASIESRGITVWTREGYDRALVRHEPSEAEDGAK